MFSFLFPGGDLDLIRVLGICGFGWSFYESCFVLELDLDSLAGLDVEFWSK